MIKRFIASFILMYILITPLIIGFNTPEEVEVFNGNEIFSIQEPINIEETEIKYMEMFTNKESELFTNNGEILSILPINTCLYAEETTDEFSHIVLDDNMEAKILTENLSKEKIKLASYDVPKIDTSFKSYTDYRCITDKKSKQYEIVQNSYTDCKGIRRINSNHDFVVALGTYYTEEVGARFLITLDTGVELFVTVGDIKADIHTEGTNRFILKNGNVVEFYVDTDVIDKNVIKHGDLSYYDQFKGQISKIEKIPE